MFLGQQDLVNRGTAFALVSSEATADPPPVTPGVQVQAVDLGPGPATDADGSPADGSGTSEPEKKSKMGMWIMGGIALASVGLVYAVIKTPVAGLDEKKKKK